MSVLNIKVLEEGVLLELNSVVDIFSDLELALDLLVDQTGGTLLFQALVSLINILFENLASLFSLTDSNVQ